MRDANREYSGQTTDFSVEYGGVNRGLTQFICDPIYLTPFVSIYPPFRRN